MPNCPICKTFSHEDSFIDQYFYSFDNKLYKLYHCKNKVCDLQWWEPLKIIPEFYEQEGNNDYVIFHLGMREDIGENHKNFFKHIPINSGRLLDVGCGDGVFIKEAQKAGFEVYGIDFDSKSIKICQEKWGLKNTFVMSLQEFTKYCEQINLKFDIITFFEVLEHQDDPIGFLSNIKSILAPGGYISGSIPNRERLFVWIERNKSSNREIDDLPPNHFLYFNKKSLNNLFKNVFSSKDCYIHIVSEAKFRYPGFILKYLKKKYFSLKFFIKRYISKNRQHDFTNKINDSWKLTFNTNKNKNFLVVFLIVKFLDLILALPAFCLFVVENILSKGQRIYFQCKIEQ